jgi:hypothetical protein
MVRGEGYCNASCGQNNFKFRVLGFSFVWVSTIPPDNHMKQLLSFFSQSSCVKTLTPKCIGWWYLEVGALGR